MTEANYLTAKEAAERLRNSTVTLARWRTKGGGPPFKKVGGKVLYALTDLEAFEAAATRTKTREH